MQKKYIVIWGVPVVLFLGWFTYWEFRHLDAPSGDTFSEFVWWLMSLHWGIQVFLAALFTWLWAHLVSLGKLDDKLLSLFRRLFNKE